VKLLYFASVRQKIGIGEEEFSLPREVMTVADLIAVLRERGGNYGQAFSDNSLLLCAVNQEHAGFATYIGPDDEIAFFPPVTGG
jgi:molybdopterin synthase sulfur carrier subunit